MARFELEKATILDADGATREYEIIKDRSTFETIEANFGRVVVGNGFLRCKGRRYVGTYGQHTPVYAGSDDDVYYAPVSFFDGEWTHVRANSRGLYNAVTAQSGTGELFADLEEFANANDLAAIA